MHIKTSLISNLVFAISTILCFSCFSKIELHYLIPEVIVQIFNPSAELAITTGILPIEAKTDIEIHLDIAETKTRNFFI